LVARRALEDLATFLGVQTAHWDGLGQRRNASDDALVAVLRSLGAPLDHPDDAPEALRQMGLAAWKRLAPPAAVVWDGAAPTLRLRFPEPSGPMPGRAVLRRAGAPPGEAPRTVSFRLPELPRTDAAEVDNQRFVEAELDLGGDLALGRYRVELEVAGLADAGELPPIHLIAGPRRAFVPRQDERGWGVFVPLYALHSSRSQGIGDLTDLSRLVDWVRGLGGEMVGTLPLLSSFLGEVSPEAPAPTYPPCDPSPYAPVSRLFWNELFIDLDRLPELGDSPEARRLRQDGGLAGAGAGAPAAGHVDPVRVMARKRPVLDACGAAFFASGGDRSSAFRRFLDRHPRVRDYARFRAATETYGRSWHVWPDGPRGGDLAAADADPARERTHLYAQFRAAEQAEAVAGGLYLDLPLGVHPDGYDAYREREVFLADVSAGAPPDPLFTRGQDWGFRPLHPRTLRASGYRYFAECLEHPMSASRVLRIDHVMGLERVFCVPFGMEARDGVYVHHPMEELLATLTLASVETETRLMGEDLGTVSDEVRTAMGEHALLRTFVLQFGLDPDRTPPIEPVPRDSVASVNTHDVPTFAAFWQGRDLELWQELGLMTPEEVDQESERRKALRRRVGGWAVAARPAEGRAPDPDDPLAVLPALIEALGASDARYVLVNLEDLWGEEEPQNVPGTSTERPNWTRRTALGLDEILTRKDLADRLRSLDRARRGPGAPRDA
jgi:4-alpha-glucanotransferase